MKEIETAMAFLTGIIVGTILVISTITYQEHKEEKEIVKNSPKWDIFAVTWIDMDAPRVNVVRFEDIFSSEKECNTARMNMEAGWAVGQHDSLIPKPYGVYTYCSVR